MIRMVADRMVRFILVLVEFVLWAVTTVLGLDLLEAYLA